MHLMGKREVEEQSEFKERSIFLIQKQSLLIQIRKNMTQSKNKLCTKNELYPYQDIKAVEHSKRNWIQSHYINVY